MARKKAQTVVLINHGAVETLTEDASLVLINLDVVDKTDPTTIKDALLAINDIADPEIRGQVLEQLIAA